MWTRRTGGGRFPHSLSRRGRSGRLPPNARAVENSRTAILLFPPAFTERNGLVEFSLLVPAGILSPDTPGWWRVFATDAAGRILEGSTARDTSRAFVR